MNRLQNQKGSVHVVIITVLVAALIFALGWIFWQNFILKEPKTSNNKPVIIKQHDTTNKTETFTDKTSGVSFEYPSNWSVATMNMSGSVMVTVKDSAAKPVAYLETNLSGLGGANPPVKYTTLSTQQNSTNLFDCAIVADGTSLYYGLTNASECAQNGSGTTRGGPVSLYFVIDTGKKNLGQISFSNVDIMGGGEGLQNPTSVSDAQQFVSSSEYAQIQTMLASFKY